MGFGSDLQEAASHSAGNRLLSGLSGRTGAKAAKEAGDISTDELIRQFGVTQGLLDPSLQAAQRQLPGIGQQLTPGGFSDTLGELQPQLAQFLQPIRDSRESAAAEQLAAFGLDPGMASNFADISPTLEAQLLQGAEEDLFNRRTALSGIGEGSGRVLSNLGQRTGVMAGDIGAQSALAAQQAQAQGQQNAMGIIGTVASMFSDERMKENMKPQGKWKGLTIYSWDWQEWVPEAWRKMNIGLSAQEVAEKHPEYVDNVNGFHAIRYNELIDDLEAA